MRSTGIVPMVQYSSTLVEKVLSQSYLYSMVCPTSTDMWMKSSRITLCTQIKMPFTHMYLTCSRATHCWSFVILPLSANIGHHVQMAEENGALLVALEHRFYGHSINPDGLDVVNLRHLSSRQAWVPWLGLPSNGRWETHVWWTLVNQRRTLPTGGEQHFAVHNSSVLLSTWVWWTWRPSTDTSANAMTCHHRTPGSVSEAPTLEPCLPGFVAR